MCVLEVRGEAEAALSAFGDASQREGLEKKMRAYAAAANVNTRGPLEQIRPCKRTGVRKVPWGRHRAYFQGHHKNCRYEWYAVKSFKKSGVDDEDDASWLRYLTTALRSPIVRVIEG